MLAKLFKKFVYLVYFNSSRKRKKQTDVTLKKNSGKHFFCNNCWHSINGVGLSHFTIDYLHKNSLIEIPEDLRHYGNSFFDYINREKLLKKDNKNVHLMTGIESVSCNNFALPIMNKQKINDKVTVHSIIGNIKEHDIPGGTESIVPYESSHIDYAASEKIIHSDHAVHKKPGAILEVERILMEHLKNDKTII